MSGLKILVDLSHPEFQVAFSCTPVPFTLLSSGLGIRVGLAAVPCAGPLDETLTLFEGYPIQPSAFAVSNLPGTLFSAAEDFISLLARAPKHLREPWALICVQFSHLVPWTLEQGSYSV